MVEVSYEKLWKKLEEEHMLKTELIKATGITSTSMARMGKGEMSDYGFSRESAGILTARSSANKAN